MVAAGPVGPALEVLRDVPPMGQEGLGKLAAEGRGDLRRVTKECVPPEPVERPDGDIHGAGPVDPELWRVPGDPVRDLTDEFGGVAIFAGEPVGLPQRGEMLEAGQLPGHLHVHPGDITVAHPLVEGPEVPAIPALEIAVPINVRAEGSWARPQEVEAVIADRVCRAEHARDGLRMLGA